MTYLIKNMELDEWMIQRRHEAMPCKVAQKSFEEILQHVRDGYDIMATCSIMSFKWHRCDRYYILPSNQYNFIQYIFNYHSSLSHGTGRIDLNIDAFKKAVLFVKSLTEKRIVFQCVGVCTETEDTLYITLPKIVKDIYRYPDLLLFCIEEELFYGTQSECFNHFIDILRGSIHTLKTTVMDIIVDGNHGSLRRRPRKMITELLTDDEISEIKVFKQQKHFLQNILSIRKTLFERLLDVWKNHLD